MNIAVAGATGFVGARVVHGLKELGFNTRALVRRESEAKTKDLLEDGADLVWGSAEDAPALRALCDGVDVVVTTMTSTMSQNPMDSIESVDLAGNCALIDAAVRGGARRFVLASFPDHVLDFPLRAAKRQVEQHLAEAKIEGIVLHIPFIFELWLGPLSGFNLQAGHVRFVGDGHKRVPFISASDVAAAVVEACRSSDIGPGIIRIEPSDIVSPREVVAKFENILHKKLITEVWDLEEIHRALVKATEPRSVSFLTLCSCYARGEEWPDGVRLTPPSFTIDDYLHSMQSQTDLHEGVTMNECDESTKNLRTVIAEKDERDIVVYVDGKYFYLKYSDYLKFGVEIDPATDSEAGPPSALRKHGALLAHMDEANPTGNWTSLVNLDGLIAGIHATGPDPERDKDKAK